MWIALKSEEKEKKKKSRYLGHIARRMLYPIILDSTEVAIIFFFYVKSTNIAYFSNLLPKKQHNVQVNLERNNWPTNSSIIWLAMPL